MGAPTLIRGHLIKHMWNGSNDKDIVTQWSQNVEAEWTKLEDIVEQKNFSDGTYNVRVVTDDIYLGDQLLGKDTSDSFARYRGKFTKNIGNANVIKNAHEELNRQIKEATMYVHNGEIGTVSCDTYKTITLNN